MYAERLIEQTIASWQPLSSTSLTREDAREMISNVVGLLELLASWNGDQLLATERLTNRPSLPQASPIDRIAPSHAAPSDHCPVANAAAEALHA